MPQIVTGYPVFGLIVIFILMRIGKRRVAQVPKE
jgi:hypothetical protein